MNNTTMKTRKFKYGSVAVLFTVAVILAVIVFNVVLSALTQKFSLYVDMTSSDLFSISDECDRVMDELMETHKDDVVPLHYYIKFCTPFDTLENSEETKLVYNCAKELAAAYPELITIEYIDIITHPSLKEPYVTTAASTVKLTDVIIESATGYRKLGIESFYTTDSSTGTVYAFNAELRFISAFLQLAGEYNPRAVFLVGHGETLNSAMMELFSIAGYDVVALDLQKGIESEELTLAPGELPDYAKVLVINAPKYDYIGANDDGLVNEIDVISRFLEVKSDATAGNLIVNMNASSAGDLPELEAYLAEWGIAFGAATLKDSASATSPDAQTIIATLPTDAESLGASMHAALRENLSSVPMIIVKNACPIYQLFSAGNYREVSSVLTTTKTAEAYAADGEGEAVRGQFDLMTISRELRYVDNEPVASHVLACSSTNFCDAEYILQNQYGNADIMMTAIREFGRDTVPIDLDFKVLDDMGLSISTKEATAWTVVVACIVPVIMLVMGTVVYIRRKHL